jgi:hypothetical protein
MTLLIALSSINHIESGTGNRLVSPSTFDCPDKNSGNLTRLMFPGPRTIICRLISGHHMLAPTQRCNPSEKCKSLMRAPEARRNLSCSGERCVRRCERLSDGGMGNGSRLCSCQGIWKRFVRQEFFLCSFYANFLPPFARAQLHLRSICAGWDEQ